MDSNAMNPPTDPADPAALAATARECLDALARSTDLAAFQELLELSAYAGESVGRSARSLAEASSWTTVGNLVGTTKQAAWARWRT